MLLDIIRSIGLIRQRISVIGLVINFRDLGIMMKVAKTLTDYAFSELQLNKVEIRAAFENMKSRAIPERLGFVNEGCIRQAEWLYDHFVDHAVYGMLAEEWNENKKSQCIKWRIANEYTLD